MKIRGGTVNKWILLYKGLVFIYAQVGSGGISFYVKKILPPPPHLLENKTNFQDPPPPPHTQFHSK